MGSYNRSRSFFCGKRASWCDRIQQRSHSSITTCCPIDSRGGAKLRHRLALSASGFAGYLQNLTGHLHYWRVSGLSLYILYIPVPPFRLATGRILGRAAPLSLLISSISGRNTFSPHGFQSPEGGDSRLPRRLSERVLSPSHCTERSLGFFPCRCAYGEGR